MSIRLFWRNITRNVPARYVFITFIISMVLIYQLKQCYESYQKANRFNGYEKFMSEISDYAQKVGMQDNNTFKHVQRLSEALQMSIKEDKETHR